MDASEPGSRARPAVVLVHGTRMSAAQWEPYRGLLPDVELVTVDLPGHGRRVGEDFTAPAALDTIGQAVRRAREAAGGAPPVLCGHSLGGYLSMMWADQHPGQLGGLVLLGATADPRSRLAGVYRGFARVLPLVGPDRMARAVNAVMRVLGARGEHARLLPDGAAYAALPAAWELVMSGGGPQLLTSVDVPVTLVNGQFDQMRLHVERYAAACRQVRVVTVPRASHLMPATHPEPVAVALRHAWEQARSR
ncbi:alpha/beta fold hydrolase [uncultured Serinicoccus sp.]|uniref:alpha/beta fold hydrolase n=1 Tax=uncultured Serinicoccus sp. TaxID=735514 RepID=UPI00262AB540|nr:alpha/beta hydrolase [uncultured Serinicoccus sp.]